MPIYVVFHDYASVFDLLVTINDQLCQIQESAILRKEHHPQNHIMHYAYFD